MNKIFTNYKAITGTDKPISKQEIKKSLDVLITKITRSRIITNRAKCDLCGFEDFADRIDSGHCRNKRENPSLRWELKNIALQCRDCNDNNSTPRVQANWKNYIDKKYGNGTYDNLCTIGRLYYKPTTQDLIEKQNKLKTIMKELQ